MICVAPGLFSTTTGWPQISESRAPIERESASVAPPGVVGTTIFTGRDGNCCASADALPRSEEHTSELQSHSDLVCRLLLEKKKRRNDGTGRVAAITLCHTRTVTRAR